MLEVQVGSLAHEELVGLDPHHHVEVPRGTAADAGLALHRPPAACVPSSIPAGTTTLSWRFFSTLPGATARRTWVGDRLAAPAAGGQVRTIVKNPWLTRTCPRPPQLRQVSGLAPGARPEP